MSTMHTANTTVSNQPSTASSGAATCRKAPIELRQSKVKLGCGALALRIDLCVANLSHSYSIGIYPGFTGGGRDADRGLVPRLHAVEFAPKMFSTAQNCMVDAWPPVPAIERRVDSQLWDDTHLPEGDVPQRLERAMSAAEPLLRQLVNHRQLHVGLGKAGQVADQPLIARIKSILAAY